MQTVLIATDFSAASRHALDYACLLLKDKDVTIDLLHVFQVPVTYTTDGIALASMQHAIERAGEHMEEEVAHALESYPDLKIEGRVITGSFLETLRQEVKLIKPLFMMLGTAGFGDLYIGDDDPLNALRSIPVPVMFVPHGAALRPITRIAYAVNYAFAGPRIPVNDITAWTKFTGADLKVVHTDTEPQGTNEKQQAGEEWLQAQLSALGPAYTWVQDDSVIRGLTGFVTANDIDCVLVVPRKYGLWQNLFHHSRTKALARLNKVPVIAFREKQ